VDTLGNVSFSLLLGGVIDYKAGKSLTDIIATRAISIPANAITGGLYGYWRELIFKKTRTRAESHWIRTRLVDILAFNSFQLPLYAGITTAGNLMSEQNIDVWETMRGVGYLAAVSPLIGTTLNWYMDRLRLVFGIKPAVKGAYNHTSSA